MNRALKIIGTVLIVLYVVFKFMVSIAIGGSSHNIPDRESFFYWAIVDFVIGTILIIAIWNWEKIFKNKEQENTDNK